MDLAFSISDTKAEEMINAGNDFDMFGNALFTTNENGDPIDRPSDKKKNKNDDTKFTGLDDVFGIKTEVPNDNNRDNDHGKMEAPNQRHAPEVPDDINVIFEREQMKERMQETRTREVLTRPMPLIEMEEIRKREKRQKLMRARAREQMAQAQVTNNVPLSTTSITDYRSILSQLFGTYTIECMFLCGVIFGIILMMIFRNEKKHINAINGFNNYNTEYSHEYTPFTPFTVPTSFVPVSNGVSTNFLTS